MEYDVYGLVCHLFFVFFCARFAHDLLHVNIVGFVVVLFFFLAAISYGDT